MLISAHRHQRIDDRIAENRAKPAGPAEGLQGDRLATGQPDHPRGVSFGVGQRMGVDDDLRLQHRRVLDAVECQPEDRRGGQVGIGGGIDDLHLDVGGVGVSTGVAHETYGRFPVLGSPTRVGPRPVARLHAQPRHNRAAEQQFGLGQAGDQTRNRGLALGGEAMRAGSAREDRAAVAQ